MADHLECAECDEIIAEGDAFWYRPFADTTREQDGSLSIQSEIARTLSAFDGLRQRLRGGTEKNSFLIRPRTRHFEQRVEARAGELLDQFIARAKRVPEHGTAERTRLREQADLDAQYRLGRELADLEAELWPYLATDRTGTMNRHVHALGEALGVRVLYLGTEDTRARAQPAQDTIETPVVATDGDYAAGLHELGHAISERCHGDDHHVIVVGATAACVRCEATAWRVALQLAITWSPMMQARLVRGLESYRAVTPAPAAALLDLARLCGARAPRDPVAVRTRTPAGGPHDSTHIAEGPRPPQTPAAWSKRLYRK